MKQIYPAFYVKKKLYFRNLIILIIGIVFFILAYMINTYDQYFEGFLFFIALPMIGFGYISTVYLLDLDMACFIEGGVSLIIPQIMSSIFYIIRNGPLNRWAYIIILILGFSGFFLGLFGYIETRRGNIKIGKRIRILLLLTLLIGILLSYSVIAPLGV